MRTVPCHQAAPCRGPSPAVQACRSPHRSRLHVPRRRAPLPVADCKHQNQRCVSLSASPPRLRSRQAGHRGHDSSVTQKEPGSYPPLSTALADDRQPSPISWVLALSQRLTDTNTHRKSCPAVPSVASDEADDRGVGDPTVPCNDVGGRGTDRTLPPRLPAITTGCTFVWRGEDSSATPWSAASVGVGPETDVQWRT